MKRIENWDEIIPLDERPQLPVGGYVCRIINAEEIETDEEHYLNLYFDIAHGAYEGFYEKDYKTNPYDDRKWRGVMRAYLPCCDGTPQDERSKSRFKGLITALEKSNSDFEWNWELEDFRDMEIGIVFRNVQWILNGVTGFTARPYMARSVDAIEDGRYRIPQPKLLANRTPDGQFEQIDDESDIPF